MKYIKKPHIQSSSIMTTHMHRMQRHELYNVFIFYPCIQHKHTSTTTMAIRHTHTQSHGHIPSSSNLKLNFRKSLRTWTLILCLIKQKSLEVIFTIISSDELTQWPKANTAMRIPSNNNNNTHKCVVRYLFIFCLPSPFMSYGAICSYAKRRSTARIFMATIRMKLHCVCVCVCCFPWLRLHSIRPNAHRMQLDAWEQNSNQNHKSIYRVSRFCCSFAAEKKTHKDIVSVSSHNFVIDLPSR